MTPQTLRKLLVLGLGAGMLVGCASTTTKAHHERNKDKSLSALLGQEEPTEEKKAEIRANLIASAKTALQAEKYDLADKTARKVLASDPQSFEARFIIAEVMLSQDSKAALEQFTALHSLQPTPDTLQGMGLAQVGSGQLLKGRETLEQVVAISPEYWRAHNGIGVSYAIKEDWEKAESAYLKAASLNAANPDVYSNLGQIYIQQKRYKDALEVFNGAADNTVGNNKFNLTYRWALALNGQMDSAMHGLNEEQSATLMNNLGESALLENDLPRAITYFKSALKAHPSYFRDADQNLQFALRQMKMP